MNPIDPGMITLQVERFPADVHKQLKLRAVRRDTTLREEVIAACMDLLVREEAPSDVITR